MKIQDGLIKGSYIITLQDYKDSRGKFVEIFNKKKYLEKGFETSFVQDNFSLSSKNILRGLHYQYKQPIGHLVSVVRGAIFDVGVDLRKDSPTFGKSMYLTLSEKNNKQVYFPPGVAHGFYSICEMNEVWYKCTNFYYPEYERGVHWKDKDFSIPWPCRNPTLKERDKNFPSLKDVPVEYLP